MATDLLGTALSPPFVYFIVGFAVLYIAYTYLAPKRKPSKGGRDYIAAEVQKDMKELSGAVGQKASTFFGAKTKLYQNFIEIGVLRRFAIISGIDIHEYERRKGKKKKKLTEEEKAKLQNHKIIIGQFHKADLWSWFLSMFGFVNLIVIDSKALTEFERSEANHDVLAMASTFGNPLGKSIRKIYIKQEIRLEYHNGIIVVSTPESMEYIKSTVWKITFENAQGEFVKFTKNLTYLNTMLAGKVELMEADAEIQDKSRQKKIKSYTRS